MGGCDVAVDLIGGPSWLAAWRWGPAPLRPELSGAPASPGPPRPTAAGRNGISTAKPKQGGSLTFGIDTEESGFDPSTARWDEGGFLYGRTVFDPIAIVTATGEVQPWLAESITSNDDFTSFTITLQARTSSSTTARRSTAPALLHQHREAGHLRC